MTHRGIHTDKAPNPVAPYSQAVVLGNLVFVSGQGSADPVTKKVVHGTIEDETDRALQNLKAVLEAAGSSLDRVVKVTAYLSDLNYYDVFNQVYGKFFTNDPRPARVCIQAGKLPFETKVEIDAIAYI